MTVETEKAGGERRKHAAKRSFKLNQALDKAAFKSYSTKMSVRVCTKQTALSDRAANKWLIGEFILQKQSPAVTESSNISSTGVAGCTYIVSHVLYISWDDPSEFISGGELDTWAVIIRDSSSVYQSLLTSIRKTSCSRPKTGFTPSERTPTRDVPDD